MVTAAPLAASAQPLPSLLQAAVSRDPALAAVQAQLRAAEQRVVQARAAFGPTVGIAANKTETRYDEAPSFALRPFASKQVALQMTQPLLRPGLVHALTQAEAQLAQAQAQVQQAQVEATQRLVEACFDVLKARDALVLLKAQRDATAEQLNAAQRSFKVGTVPVTDVREAEAKADSVAAQLAAAEYELDLRQQMLGELVGQPVTGLLDRGLTGERLPAVSPATLHDWLHDAWVGNAQLRQAEHALAAAEAELDKAWQGHGPTADLTFNYTVSSETGSTTSPFPRRADSTAVGVNVNIPLFAGGGTHAKVKEAMALRDRAQSEVESARRNVTLSLRQGFSATLSASSQAKGLEAAVRSGETALRANKRGYEVGMRVNAEVLDAQTRLYEARRDLSRARYDAWINLIKLKGLAGRLGEADVQELDGLLVRLPPDAPLPVAPLRPWEGPNR